MCGIVGVFSFGDVSEEKEIVRKEAMIFLGSELLQLTQPRGKDATGASVLYKDGHYNGLKMGIPAVEFLSRFGKKKEEYGGFIKIVRRNQCPAKAFIGHCRNGTKGESWDNNNNHPIKVGEIVGVHNGVINNDDVIFKNLDCKRDGEVDSEAVFRLLHHYTKNGTEPFTTKITQEVVNRLSGSFSVMAFSGNNPNQICMFRDGRPLEMMLIKPLKMMVCASEKDYMRHALFRFNKIANLYTPTSTKSAFPTIGGDDIEEKSLTDDSCIILDLTTKIVKGTDLDDLYDYEKMSRSKKVWQSSSVVHNRTKNGNFKSSSVKTSTIGDSSKVTGAPSTKTTTKKEDRAGMVWSEKDGKYSKIDPKEVSDKSKTDKLGSTVLDINENVEKGTVITKVSDNYEKTKKVFDLNETKLLQREKGVKGASVAEVEPDKTDDNYRQQTNDSQSDVSKIATVEIDTHTDPEAIAKSEEFTKMIERYENDKELAEAIDITDVNSLKALPPCALANRITKYLTKAVFYAGYIARKNEEDGENTESSIPTDAMRRLRVSERNKRMKAQCKIRVLKTTIRTLLRAIKFSSSELVTDDLNSAIDETLQQGESFTRKELDNVFKPGDCRNETLIGRLKYLVREKEEDQERKAR